jgi:hypothetical protein
MVLWLSQLALPKLCYTRSLKAFLFSMLVERNIQLHELAAQLDRSTGGRPQGQGQHRFVAFVVVVVVFVDGTGLSSAMCTSGAPCFAYACRYYEFQPMETTDTNNFLRSILLHLDEIVILALKLYSTQVVYTIQVCCSVDGVTTYWKLFFHPCRTRHTGPHGRDIQPFVLDNMMSHGDLFL